jgi:acetyl-CoA carboxylase biotin carboxyl carrier protein
MDLKEIQNLIKFVAKSGASEVSLEMEDVKITIKTTNEKDITEGTTIVQQIPPMVTQQQAPVAIPAVETPAVEAVKEDNHVTIKSPIIGTFYRKPSPDKEVFVEVGQKVKEGDVLCVIEAMKLFNEIESEVSGTIVKVLVDDSSPVEFEQALFVIDPS